eukprot:scaffold241265_cov17-Tisochrysis_lutea.AAC.1
MPEGIAGSCATHSTAGWKLIHTDALRHATQAAVGHTITHRLLRHVHHVHQHTGCSVLGWPSHARGCCGLGPGGDDALYKVEHVALQASRISKRGTPQSTAHSPVPLVAVKKVFRNHNQATPTRAYAMRCRSTDKMLCSRPVERQLASCYELLKPLYLDSTAENFKDCFKLHILSLPRVGNQ